MCTYPLPSFFLRSFHAPAGALHPPAIRLCCSALNTSVLSMGWTILVSEGMPWRCLVVPLVAHDNSRAGVLQPR